MGANDAQTVRASARPSRTRGRRSSSPTATASPTATTCGTAWTSRRPRCSPASGRCFATTRPARDAGRRFSWTQGAEPAPAGVRVQRDPLHDAGPSEPEGARRLLERAQRTRSRGGASTSDGLRCWRGARPEMRHDRSLHELSRASARESPRVLRGPAVRGASTTSGGWRTPGRRRSCCPRSSRSRSRSTSAYLDWHLSHGEESYAEALSYFPDVRSYSIGPDAYLEHVRRAKAAVRIPVVAQPQRRLVRRLDRLRAEDPAGRRRRDRAERLLRAHRSRADRRRRRATYVDLVRDVRRERLASRWR